MDKLKGISIFEGIVIGKPYVAEKKKSEVKVYRISTDMMEKEIKKFEEAVNETKQDIRTLIESLAGKVDKKDIKILSAHLLILEDPVFISDITTKIRVDMINVEKIVEKVVEKYAGMFRAMSNPVYKQRAFDVEDVGERLILNLQGRKISRKDLDNKILISFDIKPSDLLTYHNEGIKILGIVTEIGGETSHVAILAKTLGIPTLMGVKGLSKYKWSNYEEIILDSRKHKELVILSAYKDIRRWYLKEIEDLKIEEKELKQLIGIPGVTKDKIRANLNANMGSLKELEDIIKYQPDGIGLLRTEFLYMDSDYFPTEAEQFRIYRLITQTLGKEKPVIIRTLDIGADKKLNYFELPEEENPFLGLRAIRLSLIHKDIFKTQLRAILRASTYGNIKIMYPMISGIEEILAANKILDEVKNELKKEGLLYNNDIEVGIMIEIPSTAIILDLIIDYVDFVSIGTNDLTQYVLAADRLSKEVAHIYNNYHPAVLRMISSVADIANKAGKKVSVCGEMGGDSLALLAFLSFGITNLSMLPYFIPKIKKVLSNVDTNKLKSLKKKILISKTVDEIKEILNDYVLGVM